MPQTLGLEARRRHAAAGWVLTLVLVACASIGAVHSAPPSSMRYPNGTHLRATYSRENRTGVAIPKGATDAERRRLIADAGTNEAQRELPSGFRAILTNSAQVGYGSEASRRAGGPYLSPKALFLYRTSFHDIPLRHGSDILIVLSGDGRLLLTRRRQIPTSVDLTAPLVRAEDAIASALADAHRTFPTSQLHAESPAALEIYTDDSLRGLLAWTVAVASDSPTRTPAARYWVSATDRRILAREPLIYFAANTVQAPVVQTPASAPVASNLPHLTINIAGSGSEQSDDGGGFTVPSSPPSAGGWLLDASLAGAAVVVQDDSGTPLHATAMAPSSTTAITLSFAPQTIAELAQTSAYYWVDRASLFTAPLHAPGEPWLSGVTAHVNVHDFACNAEWYALGHALYFGGAGSSGDMTCANTAYSDVALHEYGHAVDQSNGDIIDGPYSEGFGDSIAILATQQPLVGRDLQGPGTSYRDATMLVTWPPSGPEPLADPHSIGMVYSGFVWDLVQQLRLKYTDADAFGLARQLVFAAAAANPSDIPDAVFLSILADFDASDLSTCSPHFQELAAAADMHKIPRPEDCQDTALFRTVYAVTGGGSTPPNGLAGYDLLDASDHAVALDYDADGRQDLLLYRPGAGVAWVVHSMPDGSFKAVYEAGGGGSLPAQGIAGYDLSSKRDELVPLKDKRTVFTGEAVIHLRDEIFLFRPGKGAAWVAASNGDGTFSSTYAQGDPGLGIGGYDLLSVADRALALDYDGDGKQDLLFYRARKGRVSIVHSNSDGTAFTPVYASADGQGIAGFSLTGRTDQILALDFDGNGRDDLLLYRPGSGMITIARSNGDGTFTPVNSQAGSEAGGIAGFDLRSSADRIVVLDYDGDGRDDLFLYRPGGGLAVVAHSNGDGTFTAVPQIHARSAGFAGFDFASPNDRVIALKHRGHRTDLLFYRPGSGAVWLVRAGAKGTFRPLYTMPDNPTGAAHGIGGYDLLSSDDQALAFDFNGDGNDDLLLYRPGHGSAFVLESMGK